MDLPCVAMAMLASVLLPVCISAFLFSLCCTWSLPGLSRGVSLTADRMPSVAPEQASRCLLLLSSSITSRHVSPPSARLRTLNASTFNEQPSALRGLLLSEQQPDTERSARISPSQIRTADTCTASHSAVNTTVGGG